MAHSSSEAYNRPLVLTILALLGMPWEPFLALSLSVGKVSVFISNNLFFVHYYRLSLREDWFLCVYNHLWIRFGLLVFLSLFIVFLHRCPAIYI